VGAAVAEPFVPPKHDTGVDAVIDAVIPPVLPTTTVTENVQLCESVMVQV
jgi:hypothetical protein